MTAIPQIQPITQQERTAFLERQQMIAKINEMIAKWNSMSAEWGLIGGDIDDQIDLKTKLDGISEDIADVDDRVDAVEDEIGAPGQSGTITDNISLLQSGKANNDEVVKLTGDQSISGIKYFTFPATAQWVKTELIPTGKFVKVMEMNKPTEEIDLDIYARAYWGKMALVHIRAYPQTSSQIFNTVKFEIRFSTGQICLAHNTITSKYELWTSENQCAFSLVDSFSRNRDVHVASMVATPGEAPGDKPAVGEVYEWVVDLQSI